MNSFQGGSIWIIVLIAACAALALLGIWARIRALGRRHQQRIREVEAISGLIDETRRLLAQDPKAVNTFIAEFSRELAIEFAGADWLKAVSLADIRNHVECAVFGLVQGCHCGQCAGISNGGAFWIEARWHGDGVALSGFVASELWHQHIACTPNKRKTKQHPQAYQQSTPPQNVEMTCACGRPVVTSLDYLSEGKKPKCAFCISAGEFTGNNG